MKWKAFFGYDGIGNSVHILLLMDGSWDWDGAWGYDGWFLCCTLILSKVV